MWLDRQKQSLVSTSETDGLAEGTAWLSHLNMAMSRLMRRMLVTSR